MFKGSIVALVTPFKKNGDINFEKLEELLEFHIASKTSAILILGTTGESCTLTQNEKDEMVSFCHNKIKHRIPLVVGVSSNCTKSAKEVAVKYSKLADYLLVLTPFYNKANATGLRKHFVEIADNSSCPIILYNVPSRTGVSIPVPVLKELSLHPNICGIKEASGDINYAMQVSKLLTDKFAMFSGNDDIIVPLMSIGASGVVSVLANLAPNLTSKIVADCLEQNYTSASFLQKQSHNFIKSLFCEVNPIPIKEAMNQLGFNVGNYRLPLDKISVKNKKLISDEIEKIKEILE